MEDEVGVPVEQFIRESDARIKKDKEKQTWIAIVLLALFVYGLMYSASHPDYSADPDCNISVCRP